MWKEILPSETDMEQTEETFNEVTSLVKAFILVNTRLLRESGYLLQLFKTCSATVNNFTQDLAPTLTGLMQDYTVGTVKT